MHTHTIHTYTHTHRGGTVGILLRAFCPSFQEQINRRHHFYKNSKLIKDGIVKIVGGML